MNKTQFPEDQSRTPTWLGGILCLGTPTWPPWRHVKTKNTPCDSDMHKWHFFFTMPCYSPQFRPRQKSFWSKATLSLFSIYRLACIRSIIDSANSSLQRNAWDTRGERKRTTTLFFSVFSPLRVSGTFPCKLPATAVVQANRLRLTPSQ